MVKWFTHPIEYIDRRGKTVNPLQRLLVQPSNWLSLVNIGENRSGGQKHGRISRIQFWHYLDNMAFGGEQRIRLATTASGKTQILKKLRVALSRFSNPRYRMNAQQFEKEKLENPMVLRTDVLRKISSGHFKEIRNLPKDEIFGLCEELLKSGNGEERAIAFDWAYKCQKRYERKDFKTFERWLKKYVHGWGSCDHLCVHPLGNLVEQFPEFSARTKKWAKSKNQWLRRASAVSLIPPLRRMKLLEEAFQTADILLLDKEDLVQKGYGWMLKEASNRFPREVFKYVMKHRKKMPRTALRYAIEKMPTKWKKEAMRKDL